ncbi:MAG: DNA repair protein Rad50, partial [Erysipelotrichaceae bacterium]
MNLKLNNIYGFDDFEINLSYPKKIVNSLIENEHLTDRERFRYKKVLVLMGTNASGKTSLGKALLRIITFINAGNTSQLFEMANSNKASFSIDFVNEGYTLHRVQVSIDCCSSSIETAYFCSSIDKIDSYEKCTEKLSQQNISSPDDLRKKIGTLNYRFAYPEIETSLNFKDIDKKIFAKTLKAVISTLDPTLRDINISKDLKDTFIIRRKNQEIIIQEGKLLNRDILSSGTAEGIDVAIFLSSMICKDKTFYYCDEHFSYIQSDIEKRIFGLMIERLTDNEQLIFTTHNTDMLDLNLPKHSFMFLRKDLIDGNYVTSIISASELLKRNTDSLRCAYENNLFMSL